MTEPATIPLTVIGGYLGAGKTTLLNQLLRKNAGRRLAVVINDFGSINIDASLIAEHDGETMSLTNGCICCSLANGFHSALIQLLGRPDPPQHIIVEASGVADPLKLGQYGYLPGLRLDSVVVLADAETVRRRARDRFVGRTVLRQLKGADVTVMTKPDLISDAERDEVREWLRAMSPRAAILESRDGSIPPALVLGTGLHVCAGSPTNGAQSPAETHDSHYDTWTYEQDRPMNADAVRVVLANLPDGALRAKGLVHIADTPEATIVQLVGKRLSMRPGQAWGATPRRTALVMIATAGSQDWASLEQQLDSCCMP